MGIDLDRDSGNVEVPSVLGLTVLEIAVGVMLLRDPAVRYSRMVDMLRQHCGVTICEAAVRLVCGSMMERQWLVRHPSDVDRIILTKRGEELLWGGYSAFMAIFDEGRGFIEAAFIWKLVTRRSPDELDS